MIIIKSLSSIDIRFPNINADDYQVREREGVTYYDLKIGRQCFGCGAQREALTPYQKRHQVYFVNGYRRIRYGHKCLYCGIYYSIRFYHGQSK